LSSAIDLTRGLEVRHCGKRMKRVYSTESVAMAWHIKNVLENNSVPAVVKNEQLFSVAGEIPFTECMPEVWVLNPDDSGAAEALITQLEQDNDTPGEAWHCANCNESNDGNFDVCWSCQSPVAVD
jgi:hypothetical protein